jgi:3',5'-nucleoside bisphosphate phosphatase
MHGARKYHILAYGSGVLEASFLDFAFRPTAIKNDVYSRVLADLRAEGKPLPGDDAIMAGIQDGAAPRHPGKWMLSARLIARYLAPVTGTDTATAAAVVKSRYNERKGHPASRYVATEATIALARAAGAVPVIAHPFWECPAGGNTWHGVLDDLRHFAALGLAGMEVSSRHDSPADEERRTAAAHGLGLVPFRSSDFHGNGKTEVGQFPMRAEGLIEAARRCGAEIPIAGQAGEGEPR